MSQPQSIAEFCIENSGPDLSAACYDLGCSGVNKDCPGNPKCAILQKIFKDTFAEIFGPNE